MTQLNSTPTKPAATTLGRLGLPAPVGELARRKWDVIVVGAGHNGLTCAAYLARAGKQVLVLEAREQVGGACTLQESWPGYRISPCAYVVGLLHPLVMQELDLAGHGFRWTPADGGLFVPFEDGSSVQLWDDVDRCEAELKRFAPGDLEGWRALHDLMTRTAEAIRPTNEQDLWLGPAPTREILEERLQGDEAAMALLFEWSMAELLEQYLTDERLQGAYMGQGIIGTNASPFDPGTAAIYFHHYCGKMPGEARGSWGFVAGGMGTISFLLCDIAREAGAVVATGVPVARIVPTEGVELAGGEWIYAPIVVSNADPKTTLRLLGEGADPAWQAQVERIPMKSPVVKVNAALHELPNFTARPGVQEPHHRATINIPLTKAGWQSCYETASRGELPERLWAEIYLHTAFDPTIAPPGKHVMSVFSQYVPHTFAQGDWDSRREEAGQLVISSIARHCSNLPGAIIDIEVLGPPDVEARLGLSGGHIFHGECLPDHMWSNRLSPRTPMPGIFLCGAGTHPGGSVIAVNGRNAAMEVLAEV